MSAGSGEAGPGARRLRGALAWWLGDDAATGRAPRLLRFGLAAAIAATLAVAAILLAFAHPMGDDYCNAVNVRESGVLGALGREYFHWGGRWSSSLTALAFPALFDVTRWYPLPLAASLALELVAVHLLVASALALPLRSSLAFALSFGLVALHWAGMPHPGQSAYFVEGAWTYSFNVSLAMLVVALLLRLPRGGARLAAGGGALAALALFVAAFHELVGLQLGGILAVGAAVALLERDRRGLAWAACAVGALVGVATVALSPGNAVRGPTLNPEGPDLVRALRATALMWVRILDAPVSRGGAVGPYSPLGWVDVRLLAATVVFLTIAPVRAMRPAWLMRREALLRWLVPLAVLAAITGTLLAGGWALGRTLPLRAFNALYWVFLLGWFLTAFVLTRGRGAPPALDPVLRLLRGASLVALALGLLVSTNLKHGVRDLARGSLADFDRAMESRYRDARRQREAGGRELVVSAIEPWPASYFESDVGEIAPSLEQCVAEYFGFESVRVSGSGASAARASAAEAP